MDIHDTQLRLFHSLMIVQLRRCQNIAVPGTEIAHMLVEGNEVDGNIALAHDTSGVASAAGGAASDDLNIVEAEHRTGITVTEG